MRRSSAALVGVVAAVFAGCGGGDASSSKASTRPLVPGVEVIDRVEVNERSVSWAQVEDAERYRVALLDADGRALWAGAADEPALDVPAHVMLPPDADVVVSALDADGRVLAASGR